jgi:hypothetical protein
MASSFSRGSVLALLVTLALIASGMGLVTEAVANGKSHERRHSGQRWHAERDFGHGWGWDSTYGWYAGPFFLATEKVTSVVLIPVTAGITAPTMHRPHRLEDGDAPGTRLSTLASNSPSPLGNWLDCFSRLKGE